MYINTRENLCSCPHYRWISVTPKKAQLHTTSLNNLHSNRQRGIAQVYIPTYIRTSRNSKRLPQRPINTSKPHRPARAREPAKKVSAFYFLFIAYTCVCTRESLSLDRRISYFMRFSRGRERARGISLARAGMRDFTGGCSTSDP